MIKPQMATLLYSAYDSMIGADPISAERKVGFTFV